VSLIYRIKKRYNRTGLLSLAKSGQTIISSKIVNNLMFHHPSLCKNITPKLKSVAIELTNACNLRCKTCVEVIREGNVKIGFIDIDLYKKIVDYLSDHYKGVNISLFFAGESLLHKNFIEMVEYVASKNCFSDIGFNTNGMLLNDNIIDAILKNNINVEFSLEGLANVNDNIRTGADFSKISKNIIKLVTKRGDKKKPKISIALTKSTQTNEEISEFICFFIKVVDEISVHPVWDEQLMLDERFFDESETKYINFCTMPFNVLVIHWNGEVSACCRDLNNKLVVGNLAISTLKEIWRGESIKKLRYSCLKNNFPENSICSTCDTEKISFVKKVEKFDYNLEVLYDGHFKYYSRSN